MKAIVTLTVVLMFTGCSVHKVVEAPGIPLDIKSESFVSGNPGTPQPDWWESFGDPVASELVRDALSDNLTIRASWERLEQARQLAIASGAARYPSVNADISGQQQRYEADTYYLLPPGKNTIETWRASATISYQVDLWKKISNTRKAALLDVEATRFDVEATRQTIVTSVLETWYQLVAERATWHLLSNQAAASREMLELVELRYTNGLATSLDVYQQRQALAAVEALVPESETRISTLENTLNLLLGRQPGTPVPALRRLPELPDRPTTGIPATVLRHRPDVQAAELRLVAADQRLAAAIADRFPAISLSYSLGSQSSEFENILDNWFTNLLGNLTMPIFAGGRLKAEADRNRAVVRERYLAWESAMLIAWNEVENTLVTEDGLNRTLERVRGQVELAQATLNRARDHYVNGLVDYVTVLTSLQSLQQLERQEIRTRQSLLTNRLSIHLALGSDWQWPQTTAPHDTDILTAEENR